MLNPFAVLALWFVQLIYSNKIKHIKYCFYIYFNVYCFYIYFNVYVYVFEYTHNDGEV